ncbi:hypothetical protein [Paenibacillus lemnae]|uniref:Uncharacterized protein n=1 Tax=Paenibacillus lemnae TaxID=1330551 RepID=A0A848M3L3_PAELE|nr:hypothetical protein [Paenibacillus lemnae]NMO95537.1 hypothetical protein [Paenibacillus lemnae]
MNNSTPPENNGFLFNVDILVKSPSNAFALQHLLETLNQSQHIADYRIKSGMELGGMIDQLIEAKKRSVITKAAAATEKVSPAVTEKTKKQPAEQTVSDVPESSSDPTELIKIYSKDNRLIRLTTNRQGKKFSLPCRILNYDEKNRLVTVYHVDEKQVYTFNINEIDEFSTS